MQRFILTYAVGLSLAVGGGCLAGEVGSGKVNSNLVRPAAREIGSRRQLFVDDYVIASTHNLKRTFHPMAKRGSPVMVPEHPWEGVGTAPWPSVYLFGDVLWDDEAKQYRMWYTTAKKDMKGGQHDVLYATSEDGIRWHKPLDLGIVEYEGSSKNNILLRDTSAQTVLKVAHETEPAKTYQLLTFDRNVNAYAWRYSPDGLHWSDPVKITALAGKGMFDNLNVAYDDVLSRYVIAVKKFDNTYEHPVVGRLPGPGFRRWFMTTSRDGMDCTPLVEMPDLIDEVDKRLYMEGERCSALNTYGISLFSYHGVLLGIQWLFRVADTEGFYACHGGPMDGRLVFSRDPNEQWRIPTREFILPRGRKEEWDWGMICGIANRPVVSPDGSEWWYYYGGWSYGHGVSRRRACIGLAKLRVDGFASIDSLDAEGVLETMPLRFLGRTLKLNVNATGQDTEGTRNYARAELLDETGHVIDGYGKNDCDPIHGNCVDCSVTWKGDSDVSHLRGREIRMKVYLKGAELYAFQFQD